MLTLKIDEKEKINRVNKIIDRVPIFFRNSDLSNTSNKLKEYYCKNKYNKKGLFLYGPCGTGKTYSLYALTIYLIMSGYNVKVINLSVLFNIIRSSFNKQQNNNIEKGSMKNIDELIDFEILAIDDIGKQKTTEWVDEMLYYIINTRYENKKITFFTSNLSLDELSNKIDDSIVSRITETCEVYKLEGQDKRLKL